MLIHSCRRPAFRNSSRSLSSWRRCCKISSRSLSSWRTNRRLPWRHRRNRPFINGIPFKDTTRDPRWPTPHPPGRRARRARHPRAPRCRIGRTGDPVAVRWRNARSDARHHRRNRRHSPTARVNGSGGFLQGAAPLLWFMTKRRAADTRDEDCVIHLPLRLAPIGCDLLVPLQSNPPGERAGDPHRPLGRPARQHARPAPGYPNPAMRSDATTARQSQPLRQWSASLLPSRATPFLFARPGGFLCCRLPVPSRSTQARADRYGAGTRPPARSQGQAQFAGDGDGRMARSSVSRR